MDSNYVRILTDEEAMHALEDAVKHGRALPFEAAERLLNGMGTFTPAPLSPDVEAAVEYIEKYRCIIHFALLEHIDTLLHAVRAPRLTEEQREAVETAFREGYSLGQTDGSAMDGCMGCYDPAPVDDVETAWKESDTRCGKGGLDGISRRPRTEPLVRHTAQGGVLAVLHLCNLCGLRCHVRSLGKVRG